MAPKIPRLLQLNFFARIYIAHTGNIKLTPGANVIILKILSQK
jgi:hypothetical protein